MARAPGPRSEGRPPKGEVPLADDAVVVVVGVAGVAVAILVRVELGGPPAGRRRRPSPGTSSQPHGIDAQQIQDVPFGVLAGEGRYSWLDGNSDAGGCWAWWQA